MFNALWAVSERALANIARELGIDPEPHLQEAERISAALGELFDEDLGC
jgi:hypothetical protein